MNTKLVFYKKYEVITNTFEVVILETINELTNDNRVMSHYYYFQCRSKML